MSQPPIRFIAWDRTRKFDLFPLGICNTLMLCKNAYCMKLGHIANSGCQHCKLAIGFNCCYVEVPTPTGLLQRWHLSCWQRGSHAAS